MFNQWAFSFQSSGSHSRQLEEATNGEEEEEEGHLATRGTRVYISKESSASVFWP